MGKKESSSSSNNWSLLGRFRKAVKQIRFLLNFNMNRWKLASIIGGGSNTISSNSNYKRRLMSFNDRPGLRACMDSDEEDKEEDEESISSSSRGRRKGRHVLQRTISYPMSGEEDGDGDEEDIDKRAENFIANFYKQLQFERQISLEIRYARSENSFNSTTSASP